MPKAMWNGQVIAQSEVYEKLEGNVYFPRSAVNDSYLRESEHTSVCPWKGTAHYFHLDVNGQRNANAAWFYPQPSPAAQAIQGHVAFWKGVTVTE